MSVASNFTNHWTDLVLHFRKAFIRSLGSFMLFSVLYLNLGFGMVLGNLFGLYFQPLVANKTGIISIFLFPQKSHNNTV